LKVLEAADPMLSQADGAARAGWRKNLAPKPMTQRAADR
jgi:hypothetical protein